MVWISVLSSSFAIGGLLRIDGRRGVGHVDPFGEFLQVIQRDGEFGRAGLDGLRGFWYR